MTSLIYFLQKGLNGLISSLPFALSQNDASFRIRLCRLFLKFEFLIFCMRLKLTLLLPGIALFAACTGETSRTPGTTSPDPVAAPAARKDSASAEDALRLHAVHAEHAFSYPTTKDKFLIELTGKDTLEGTVDFVILNSRNDTIHHEQFRAADLEASLVYEMQMPQATPQERKDFVIRRMDEFFGENRFSQPLTLGPTYDPEPARYYPRYIDPETWLELKSNPHAIGFHYLLGKEENKFIAYSNRKKQVVLYQVQD